MKFNFKRTGIKMFSSKTHGLNVFLNDSALRLKSEILAACIGYGSHDEKYKFITGFSDAKRNGYAILLKIISLAFDGDEIPINDDRIYIRYGEEVEAFIASLSRTQLNEIVGELVNIYRHLQGILNAEGVTHIKLRREISPRNLPRHKINEVKVSSRLYECLNYSDLLMLYKSAADLLGKEKIPVHMDVLNSFTDTNNKGGYGSISIELSIPAEDVLYSYLMFPSGQMEGDEWIIMNRSLTGIVEIPASSIVISDTKIRDFYKESFRNLTLHSAQQLFDMEHSRTWGHLPRFYHF